MKTFFNAIVTSVSSSGCDTLEKDSERIKKCVAMEATRCDQKWTFLLLAGIVVRISWHTDKEVLNIEINRRTEAYLKKIV
jgi:hypothetical protein